MCKKLRSLGAPTQEEGGCRSGHVFDATAPQAASPGYIFLNGQLTGLLQLVEMAVNSLSDL